MAASEQNSEARPRSKTPGLLAIAFAATIVSSRPKALSIKEYVHHLSTHVVDRRHPRASSTSRQQFDSPAYWRSEAQRLEKALQGSETHNAQLRRENDAMRAGSESGRINDTVKRKRRSASRSVDLRSSPSKKPRSEQSSLQLTSPVRELRDIQLDGPGEDGDALLCSIYHVHSMLSRQPPLDTDRLAYHLARAATAISRLVETAVNKHIAASGEDEASLDGILKACGRSMPLLIKGSGELTKDHTKSRASSHASHALVTMFDSLLRSLQSLCEHGARIASSQSMSGSSTARTSTTGKLRKIQKAEDGTGFAALATILNGLIEQLDPQSVVHKTLFEGFMFCLISKLGANLYPIVFGHVRGTSIEEEIRAANPSPDDQDAELLRRRVSLEAPFLICLLNRAMSASRTFLGQPGKSTTTKSRSARTLTKASIARALKDRLQYTMINAIFGTEAANHEVDMFAGCLKMPAAKEQIMSVPRIKEADKAEWFQQEAWRILGWEVLAGDSIMD